MGSAAGRAHRLLVLAVAFGVVAAADADAATLRYDLGAEYWLIAQGEAVADQIEASTVAGVGGALVAHRFTSVQPFTSVPGGCASNQAMTEVTCEHPEGSDVDRIVINGGGGDDVLRYTVTTSTALPGNLYGDEGNDVLNGSGRDDSLNGGSGQNILRGGAGEDTLTCSGIDVAAYDDGRTDGVHVTIGASGGTDGTVGIDGAEQVPASCHAVIGTPQADTLLGDGGGNYLEGLAGDDVLAGGVGSDYLVPGPGNDAPDGGGGGGSDEISYDDGRSTGVTVNIGNPGGNDGSPGEIESADGFEYVTGSAHDDSITGTEGVNILRGGGGDDALRGRGGADALGGGDGDDTLAPGGGADQAMAGHDGVDTLRCDDLPVTTTVDLAAEVGCEAGEPVREVENVIGTAGADRIAGDDGPNRIDALDGQDTITARGGDDIVTGGAGADRVTGGDGSDTFSLDDDRTTGATVTLAAGGDDLDGGEDPLGFENLLGGLGPDVLVGDDGPNVLQGGPGADQLDGGAGVDSYDAGADDDVLATRDGAAETVVCGDGADTASADASDSPDACETFLVPPLPDPSPTPGPAQPTPGPAQPTPTPTVTPPPGAPAIVAGRVSARFSRRAGRTQVRKLVVTGLPAGATVDLICRARAKRACPLRTKRRRIVKPTVQLDLTSLLKRRRLPASTTIEVRITKPGLRGRRVTYLTRRTAAPKRTIARLPT